MKEFQVETIVDALCSNMVSDKEQLRDISSIGLKTVISELPLGSNALAANVCRRITGRLSTAIEKESIYMYLFFLIHLLFINTICTELMLFCSGRNIWQIFYLLTNLSSLIDKEGGPLTILRLVAQVPSWAKLKIKIVKPVSVIVITTNMIDIFFCSIYISILLGGT